MSGHLDSAQSAVVKQTEYLEILLLGNGGYNLSCTKYGWLI